MSLVYFWQNKFVFSSGHGQKMLNSNVFTAPNTDF